MPSVATTPSELLLQIFEEVPLGLRHRLCGVCKHWNGAATSILYTTVEILGFASLISFYCTLQFNPGLAELVHSLRVSPGEQLGWQWPKAEMTRREVNKAYKGVLQMCGKLREFSYGFMGDFGRCPDVTEEEWWKDTLSPLDGMKSLTKCDLLNPCVTLTAPSALIPTAGLHSFIVMTSDFFSHTAFFDRLHRLQKFREAPPDPGRLLRSALQSITTIAFHTPLVISDILRILSCAGPNLAEMSVEIQRYSWKHINFVEAFQLTSPSMYLFLAITFESKLSSNELAIAEAQESGGVSRIQELSGCENIEVDMVYPHSYQSQCSFNLESKSRVATDFAVGTALEKATFYASLVCCSK